MRFLAALLLFAINAQALTGGSYSTNARYSAIIKIRADFGPGRNRQNCTGTFISPRHILTAAHCLLNTEKKSAMSPIKVDMSTFPKMDLFWDPITVSIPAAKFEVHPSYIENPKASNPNDVAVIVLNRTYSRSTLRLTDGETAKGSSILMTGYGCDKKEKSWSTDFKYGAAFVVDSGKFLKLGRSEVEYCQGDSGGPVLIETPSGLRIVGVASYMNVVKGFMGFSKDRAIPVGASAPTRAWIKQQLAK